VNCLIDPNKLLKEVCSFDITGELGHYMVRVCIEMQTGKCNESFIVKEPTKRVKSSDYTEEFEAFWSAYPKKTGKGGAFALFKKLFAKQPSLHIDCIDALAWQTKQDDWKKDNGKYIPMPETYLSKRRWEDEKPVQQEKVRRLTPDGIWVDC
jgi:hypothetical protein